jgi:hypothetical protein
LSLICSIAGHRPDPRTVWNDGLHFSRCLRCRADLLEQDGRWQTSPRGFRIVWKDAELQLDTLASEPAETEAPAPARRRGRKKAESAPDRPTNAKAATRASRSARGKQDTGRGPKQRRMRTTNKRRKPTEGS